MAMVAMTGSVDPTASRPARKAHKAMDTNEDLLSGWDNLTPEQQAEYAKIGEADNLIDLSTPR